MLVAAHRCHKLDRATLPTLARYGSRGHFLFCQTRTYLSLTLCWGAHRSWSLPVRFFALSHTLIAHVGHKPAIGLHCPCQQDVGHVGSFLFCYTHMHPSLTLCWGAHRSWGPPVIFHSRRRFTRSTPDARSKLSTTPWTRL